MAERPKFDWRDAPRDPLRRYESVPRGNPEWRDLVLALTEARSAEACRDAFDQFIGQMSAIANPPPPPPYLLPPPPKLPCVFISHQQKDTKRGERVACLAQSYGIGYWLDVHDPLLNSINNSSVPPGVILSILIAAAVEIGLLNSTHVIALHTQNSLGSKWVPYELGRAKVHNITSNDAAGWFASNPLPGVGEYVHLVLEAYTEAEVVTWLQKMLSVPTNPTQPKCMSTTVSLDASDDD